MCSCNNSLQRLDQAIEEKTPLPTDVREHLSHCSASDCQTALIEFDLLNSAIQTWKSTLPESDLTQQILDDVSQKTFGLPSAKSQSQRLSRQTPHSPMTALLCVCGALSLCLIGVLQSIPQSSNDSVANHETVQPDHSIADVTEQEEPVQVAEAEQTEVEAELREFGRAYGSWIQGATHKLTDTVTVVLLENQQPQENAKGWFTELTDQIEQPFESTLKFLQQEATPSNDEQTFREREFQNEYFGFLLSKSASLKPLFTLMFV